MTTPWPRPAPAIVYAFDADGTCTMSEGHGLVDLGLQPGQMVGVDLLQAYAGDPPAYTQLARCLAGEAFTTEIQHAGRVLETWFQPLSGPDGTTSGGLGVVSDVTEQRRLEEESREAERRGMALVDLTAALARDVVDPEALLSTAVRAATEGTRSSGALWLLEPEGRRLRVRAFRPLVRDGRQVVPQSDVVDLERLEIERAVVEEIPRSQLFDLRDDPDTGSHFGDRGLRSWLAESGAHSCLRVPLRARGALLGAMDLVRRTEQPPFTEVDVEFAVDVAERCALALDNALLLQAQRDSLEELVKFKALADATSDLVAIADPDGTLTYLNPPGRRMVGMPEDLDVTGTTVVDYLTEEGLQRFLSVERPAVVAHGFWEGESTLRDWGGGPPIPVSIVSFLIRDPEDGTPVALATVQRDLSDRVAAEVKLRELAEQRQQLLTRLVDAQDVERAHIAAEVHDDSVQVLAAVDLRLGLLARRIGDHAPDLLEYLEPLRATVSEATDRLRSLLFDLTPVDLEHGLAGALREVAREMYADSDTEVSIVSDDLGELSTPTLRVAYRIAKEALFNARKHARADHVVVALRVVDGGLALSVRDDGIGIPDDRLGRTAGHLGLSNMEDRAQIAGGDWAIRRCSSGGIEVLTWLPGSQDGQLSKTTAHHE